MATVLVTSAADPDLVEAAIAGDGTAFATLYDRHERRAFNLAYRITGSREDAADATQEAFLKLLARLPGLADRELDFGAYLLTAVRHASYDVIARAKRADPTEDLPESARPVGAAAAPPPEEEPDRSVLLAASQEEIRAANATLAPRQREALALRELEGLSYDEIAELMAMNRNSVAQLISRARIALRDALRRTALRSIAPGTPQCERALPLIAMRDDGQLTAADDAGWLDAHLAVCERCVLGREAMAEAGASYRIWAAVPALEVLRRETIANAGQRLGHDWSAAAGSPRTTPDATTGDPRTTPGPTVGSPRTAAGGAAAGAGSGAPDSAFAAPPRSRSRRRRDGLAALALCAAILLALLAGQTADGERGPATAGDPAVAQPTSEDPAPAPAARAGRAAPAPRPVAAAAPAPGPDAVSGAPVAAAAPRTARRPPAPADTKRESDARPTTTPPATPPPPPPASTPDTGPATADPTPPPPPPPGSVPEDPTGGTGSIVVTPPPPPPPRRRPGSFVAPPPPPPPPSSVPQP